MFKYIRSNLINVYIGVFTLIVIFCCYLLDTKALSTFFHDDSYFYLKIAYNYAAGNGNTFDGIHFTDGFHSTYMLWLSLISYFLPIKGDNGQLIVAAFDILLFSAGLLIIERALKKCQWNITRRLIVICTLIFAFALKDFGMECRLTFIVFSIFVSYLLRQTINKTMLVVLGSLFILIRLDYIIMPFSIILYLCLDDIISHKKYIGFLKNSWLGIIPVVFVVINLLTHKILFGHYSSISSSLKGSLTPFPQKYYVFAIPAYFWKVNFILILSVVNILALLIFNKRNVYKRIFILPMFTLLYIAITSIFMNGRFHIWYLNILMTINLFVSSFIFVQVFMKDKKLHQFLSLGISTCIMIIFVYSTYNRTVNKKSSLVAIDYALNLKNILRPDEKVFQVDECGRVGYFSERIIINGDGLVNDRDYRKYLVENKLQEYLKKEQVSYLSHNKCFDLKEQKMIVPKWNAPNAYIIITNPSPIYQLDRFALYSLKDSEVSFVY